MLLTVFCGLLKPGMLRDRAPCWWMLEQLLSGTLPGSSAYEASAIQHTHASQLFISSSENSGAAKAVAPFAIACVHAPGSHTVDFVGLCLSAGGKLGSPVLYA